MNTKVFGKIGLAVAKVMVPQIGTVEEAIKGIKTGPDKKKAVIETVASSLELAEQLSGRELVDVALFQEGLSEINDGYVKILKSIHQSADQPADQQPAS